MNEIYLISLAKDTKRRELLQQKFSSYDSFKLIDAVDGRELNAREYYKIISPSFKAYGKVLSPAEVGCSLSHVKAYEEFLASEAKFALIFEDDVIGSDQAIKEAFLAASKMPENSVLICGMQDGLEGRFSAFGKKVDTSLSRPLWQVSKHSFSSIYRAGAYVLTKKSAKNLLEIHKRALCTTDVWDYLLGVNDMQMYFCDLFAHPTDLSGSNIEGERLERGYSANLNAYIKTIKFIFFSRLEKLQGYERIFKRG
ncbi:glycosyltransferase family 25 protein [Campylobacter concisus]|uniref:Glycosyltransferase family 25 protein n=1 Tax=Campylobacter concisus TaxID=199 RepID=A0AAE7P406_9BACT|nr:glycosyltransferase family 25 protein [Campylobacter concisus]QPH86778.1 glycosyltransferase family 25 protein [Campylobacter concisus]